MPELDGKAGEAQTESETRRKSNPAGGKRWSIRPGWNPNEVVARGRLVALAPKDQTYYVGLDAKYDLRMAGLDTSPASTRSLEAAWTQALMRLGEAAGLSVQAVMTKTGSEHERKETMTTEIPGLDEPVETTLWQWAHDAVIEMGGKRTSPPAPRQESTPAGDFARRITDTKKVSLAPEFIRWIRDVAAANGLTDDEVWTRWQAYSKQCDASDQSPVESEFLQWNQFKEPAESRPAARQKGKVTLADHAEAWWKEHGKTVPKRGTPAWNSMYHQWVEVAFASFRKSPKGRASESTIIKYEKKGNYIRERVMMPSECKPGSFRTIPIEGKKGHKQIICRPKGMNTTRSQVILHPLSEESKLRARAKRQGVSFVVVRSSETPEEDDEEILEVIDLDGCPCDEEVAKPGPSQTLDSPPESMAEILVEMARRSG